MACLNFLQSCPCGAYTSRTEIELQNLKDDSPDGFVLFVFIQIDECSASNQWKREKIMCIVQVEKLNAL